MSPKKTTAKKTSSKKETAAETASRASAKPSRKKASNAGSAAPKKPATGAPKPSEMQEDVLEFIQAIDDYKRAEGRPFPTWSEILDIVKELGYERRA